MQRLRHFSRWMPNGWWPWAIVPVVVVLALLLAWDSPLALVSVIALPASLWIGFTRHERRVAKWKRPDAVRLGMRGKVTAGEYKGLSVVVDVAGMTPVDPVVVVTSEDLDEAGHATERVLWVNPEDLDARLKPWAIRWTGVPDDRTARRFGP